MSLVRTAEIVFVFYEVNYFYYIILYFILISC